MKTSLVSSLRKISRVAGTIQNAAGALVAGLLLLAGAPSASGASSPPERMSYQGFLVDGNGNPLAPATPANYPVIFRIYPESDTGDSVWTEQQVVTVDKGNFSVILGEGSPVSPEPHGDLSAVFASNTASDRYMGITVTIGANNLTLLPRLRMLPSPYAFLARQAVQLINPSSGAPFINLNGTETTIPGNARFGGETFWGTGAYLRNDHGGSIELGNSLQANVTPYLDFHFGKNQSQDYNMRLINDADGRLGLYGGRLSMGNSLADVKLALWEAGSETYGFGVQGNQLRLHVGHSNARFSFLNAVNGTEIFTIRGNGDVGIGTGTATPKARLHNPLDYYGRGHLYLFAYEGDGGNGTAFVQARDTSGTSSIDMQFRTQKSGGIRDVMRLTQDGRVGINNVAPRVPLEVSGWGNVSANFIYYSRTGNSPFTGHASGVVDYSILSERRVGASEFNSFSDARIKTVVGTSDSQKDLEMISKLKVTDYYAADKIAEGGSLKKGFIAQEVAALIPEAVTTAPGFVPDIYTLPSSFEHDAAAKKLAVKLARAHGVKKGDKVRILADEARLELVVAEVPSAEEFVLAECEKKPSQMFVFGKEVPDFHTLNYDRIFTTGISAIQELHRKVESKDAQIRALEQEVAGLKKQIVAEAQAGANLEARFAALEKLVAAARQVPGPEVAAAPAR